MRYLAAHTMDESGGRYAYPMLDGAFDTAEEAQAIADKHATQGGFVSRSDGALLSPVGTWIDAEGNDWK